MANLSGNLRPTIRSPRQGVIIVCAVVIAAVAGLVTWRFSTSPATLPRTSGQQTTSVRNGEVWLHGKITQDTCDMSETHIAIGDVGCSITVNGYQVSIGPSNARPTVTPGTVTGLDTSTDQTGSHADVYAQLTGPHSASILGAPKYYARISG